MAVAECVLLPPHRTRLPYDSSFAAAYRAQRDAYAHLARAQGSDRIWLLSSGMVPDVAVKLASWYGVRAIDDYEPLLLGRQADYFTFAVAGTTTVRPPGQGRLRPLPASPTGSVLARTRRLLDLAAVRLIAIDYSMIGRPEVRAFLAEARLEAGLPLGRRLTLFENPHALPRAFVVYRVHPAPGVEELLTRLSAPDFDPLSESYVEGNQVLPAASGAFLRGEAAAVVRDGEQAVDIEATLARPGLVVLADSFHPGWRASVDGVPAPIVPTNHLFRGVPVPEGRHLVRFEYRPWSFTVGVAVSAVSLLAIGALFVTRSSSPH